MASSLVSETPPISIVGGVHEANILNPSSRYLATVGNIPDGSKKSGMWLDIY